MNDTVVITVVGALMGVLTLLISAWVKRIEGRDKLFRNSVRQDMRIMYALKDDYGQLHSWAVNVRGEWRTLQAKLREVGVITEISDLPPIPKPTWEEIEDEAA